MRITDTRVALSFVALCCCSATAPEVRFVAGGEIPSDARDLENETVGAIGSGAAFDAATGECLFVSDRGPGDGEIDYRPRMDTVRVSESAHRLDFKITRTTLFRDSAGRPMTGLIPDFAGGDHPRLRDGRWCIDPEAIAIGADGSIFVSDEYGPFLYQFARDGHLLRCIKPPAHYLPRKADGGIDFSNNEALVSGRQPNRGFEGMTLSPDKKRAILALQSGLVQDGGKDSRFTRILVLDLKGGNPIAEYAYPLENPDEINTRDQLTGKDRLAPKNLCITEITAVNDRQFLVLERDNRGADGSSSAKQPIHKCIYLVDFEGASDLLPHAGEPIGDRVVCANKKLLIDLLKTPCGIARDKFAEKWEGLALTPSDPRGHRRLLVACDNDFLNPKLRIENHTVSFPRARQNIGTQILMFDLVLPR